MNQSPKQERERGERRQISPSALFTGLNVTELSGKELEEKTEKTVGGSPLAQNVLTPGEREGGRRHYHATFGAHKGSLTPGLWRMHDRPHLRVCVCSCIHVCVFVCVTVRACATVHVSDFSDICVFESVCACVCIFVSVCLTIFGYLFYYTIP